MPTKPYSFSKLSTHVQCPRKYKYAYIDKAPEDQDVDITALLKGRAVHSIIENYPNKSTHAWAPKYQHIADKFFRTSLAKKYLTIPSTREHKFGISKKLEPTEYNDKEALFRGLIDYITIIDKYEEEILTVESIDDISDEYEIIEILDE